MALGDVIARLAVSLNLETASFEKGSKRAQSEVGKLRGTVQKSAAAIGAAFAGMMSVEFVKQWADMSKQALDAVGSLGEVATQLGVTTDALQEYRFIATQTGVAQEEMDQALAQLTRRLGDAAQGAKAPAEALKRLGISMKEIKGLSAGDLIPLIAEGMSKIDDETQRAAIAVDLFGKAGQKLMPLLAEGKTGIEGLRQAAHDYGIVMSEAMIQNADATADALSKQQELLKIQENALLATPENAKAVMEYTKTITELRIELYKLLPQIGPAFDALEKGSQRLGTEGYDLLHINIREELIPTFQALGRAVESMAASALASIGKMVAGIRNWVTTTLGAVWEGALAKIEQVKSAFYNMYDAVVGHSYVPDMVDGIAAQMARLDGVMVKPVTAATTKAQLAFLDLAGSVREMMGNLFPEEQSQIEFGNQNKTIVDALAAHVIDAATADKLSRGAANAEDERKAGNRPSIDWMSEVEPMTQALDVADDSLQRLADRAEENTVRIAKSFKDMANDTLNSLSSLTSAIKSGDFLSIFEGVIGLGLQLASSGLFGKTVQTNLNKTTKGYAAGTLSAAPGLALVGEKGPELVSFRGGERVYNNRDTQAMMGGGVMEIRPSPLFEVYVNGKLLQAAPAIANAGAIGGAQRVAYANSRNLG